MSSRKWARTESQKRRDRSICWRHHNDGENELVRVANRTFRYENRRFTKLFS